MGEKQGPRVAGIKAGFSAVGGQHAQAGAQTDALQTAQGPVLGHDQRDERGAEGRHPVPPTRGQAAAEIRGPGLGAGRAARGDHQLGREQRSGLRTQPEQRSPVRSRRAGRFVHALPQSEAHTRLAAQAFQAVGEFPRRAQAENLSEAAFLPGDVQFGQQGEDRVRAEAAEGRAAGRQIGSHVMADIEQTVGDVAHAAAGQGQLAPGPGLMVDEGHGQPAPGRLHGADQSRRARAQHKRVEMFAVVTAARPHDHLPYISRMTAISFCSRRSQVWQASTRRRPARIRASRSAG